MFHPKPYILYVDDDADSCEMISIMLQLADGRYAITAVETAQKALNVLSIQKFDLYILDYHLPEMGGVELCQKIRQTDLITPILFYSAMARKIDKKEALAAGATEYLVKPNDLDRLVRTVERLLIKTP